MKTGKRIVSKRQYAAGVGKVTALTSLTIALLLAGGIAGRVALSLLRDMHNSTGIFEDDWGMGQPLILLIGVGCLLFLSLGAYTMKYTRKIDIGVPLSRANTSDLPADESLVRASQEPMQEQQSILLRAATEVQQTPPEQLLRASADIEH